ncbi:tautomerase family protein [Cupriavidus taiwanensis]|uniref:tautomerase family protein n=1 Tax=Cupriavidus taiwanensis TaxID=164546 RepID=UPI0039C15A0B
MPLLKFDIIRGRSSEEIRKLLDVTHEAMVEAFEVPLTDRYQVVTQHEPEELILEDTGLGYRRTADVILLTIISRPRSLAQKTKFYGLLVEKLQASLSISPQDVVVSLVENADADWSFGCGRAQFITGEL